MSDFSTIGKFIQCYEKCSRQNLLHQSVHVGRCVLVKPSLHIFTIYWNEWIKMELVIMANISLCVFVCLWGVGFMFIVLLILHFVTLVVFLFIMWRSMRVGMFRLHLGTYDHLFLLIKIVNRLLIGLLMLLLDLFPHSSYSFCSFQSSNTIIIILLSTKKHYSTIQFLIINRNQSFFLFCFQIVCCHCLKCTINVWIKH